MTDPHSPLRINVGFIIHQTIGYSRDFEFDLPEIHLDPDLDLDYLTGLVKITRTPQGLLVQAKFNSSVAEECVRCLSEFSQPLHTEFSELYAFNRKSITESGLILPEDGHIDLNPLVREFLLLEVPINPLCRADCKGLCPVCGNNLNETQCNHETNSGDNRLEKLKTLL